MGCKPDKPTAPGSNILLTKRKRKYVRLLLSSGVGGCYRTRWFKLVFHLPGWWENTACLTTSTVTAALPIDGWQWFQGAIAPSESRGPKVPVEIWDSYSTVSGLGAGSNISRSEPWWFQQESLAVIFKQGPRPHHQHHPTYWIRNSVAGIRQQSTFYKPARQFWCSFEFVNHWAREKELGWLEHGDGKMSCIRFKLQTIRCSLVSQIYWGLSITLPRTLLLAKMHHLCPSPITFFQSLLFKNLAIF